MKTVLLAIILTVVPAFARAESDPFELPNPTTGEPGVWLPVWAQRLSLKEHAELQLCTEAYDEDQKLIAEKNAEISERITATTLLKSGLKNAQSQLAGVQQQLKDARNSSQNRLVWALIATGGVLVSGIVLTIVAVH